MRLEKIELEVDSDFNNVFPSRPLYYFSVSVIKHHNLRRKLKVDFALYSQKAGVHCGREGVLAGTGSWLITFC